LYFTLLEMKDLEENLNFKQLIERLDNYTTGKETPFDDIIKICQDHLYDLRNHIFKEGFDSINSEITFFKEIKQHPLQTLIYSSRLKSFEVRFPKGNQIKQQKYILNNIKKINRFFLLNTEFSQYVQKGLVYLDEFYYTRKYFSESISLFSAPFFRDPDFSTSHDLLLANHTVNCKLLRYLENRLYKLKDSSLKETNSSKLNWTSTKAALTELVYALYASGSLNNGNTDIKEIAMALQRVFQFDLGDFYKTYSEIKARKISRTKFLDDLSSGLIAQMDNSEI
jgi:hypothetical protein